MKKFLYFTLVAAGMMLTAAHPIHVSVADVEFVPDKQELQIIVRIFTDDLEREIRQEINKPKVDILIPGEGLTSDGLFKDYLNKHIRFNVNGKDAAYQYLGHEVDAGSVICYLLIDKVKKLESLQVKNDILLSIYDDQVNLVHITIDDDIQTMKFVRGEENQSKTFK
ncbi:DUF6702 family protein [Fulvivirga sedimenti]|uniref:Peptidase E n=1 Tax=Fulvivirga sedimenti TaxID=2879465 RepID=A0A9X1HX70_9BACT|nr:DUF6702 family protein [Fulvivirga sedimenti]MCA6078417.1 hypothetical protein [Fulvivirga sedimenti]